MGRESLLSGGVGLPLVLGKASSVPGTVVMLLIRDVNLPSRVRTLLESPYPVGDYVTNIKHFSFLFIEQFKHRLKASYSGAYPIYSPQDISYDRTQN